VNWRDRIIGQGSGGVFRGMLTLAAGGVAAKVIGLASIPVLTRIYTPEQMGILSTFTAIVALLAPFGTLRYVAGLPVPRKDATAINLLFLSLVVLVSFTLLLSAGAWGFGALLLSKAELTSLISYLPLIVLGVFLSGFYEMLTLWATRKKEFRTLALSQANQAISGNLLKIALGFLGFKTAGLIIGQVAQIGGGVLPLFRILIPQLMQFKDRIRLARMRKMAKLFRDMPQYRLPSQFLLMASMQGPALLSAHIYGMETAGQLGLALTALALPINLLGTTTGNAYFSEISNIGRSNPKKILAISKDVTKRLFFLSMIPALLLMIVGPWIFTVAFGERWTQAGEFARILSIYLAFQFISSPLGNALTLFRRQDILLKMNFVRFIIILLIFSSAKIFEWNSEVALLIYSISLSIHYFASNRMIFRIIRQNMNLKEGQ